MSTVSPAAAAPPGGGRSLWLSGVSDELLARHAARGSQRAVGVIYERYHQPLYRYCRSIVRDEADAQDALQSTFTAALDALQRDARRAPLRPWLYRIAHNESISLLRRRTRDSQHQSVGEAMVLTSSAADEAAARARWQSLLGDLAQLPERQRGALLLREMAGLSHEEIAVALGLTVGGAKQAIFEARQGLAEVEEGRAMSCEEVRRRISEGDRRVLRGRRVRGHLRECAACEAFAQAIPAREAELRALVPALPPAAAAAILGQVMRTASTHSGSAAGSVATAGALGKVAGTAVGWKALAGAALVAGTAAGVAGLTHATHHAQAVNRTLLRSEQQPMSHRASTAHAGIRAAHASAVSRHAAAAPRVGLHSATVPGRAPRGRSHPGRHGAGMNQGTARGASSWAPGQTSSTPGQTHSAAGRTQSAAVHARHTSAGGGSARSTSHRRSSSGKSHARPRSKSAGPGASSSTTHAHVPALSPSGAAGSATATVTSQTTSRPPAHK